MPNINIENPVYNVNTCICDLKPLAANDPQCCLNVPFY